MHANAAFTAGKAVAPWLIAIGSMSARYVLEAIFVNILIHFFPPDEVSNTGNCLDCDGCDGVYKSCLKHVIQHHVNRRAARCTSYGLLTRVQLK